METTKGVALPFEIHPLQDEHIAPEGDPGRDCDGAPQEEEDPESPTKRRVAVLRSATASGRGWGPGWPNCQRDQIVTVSFAGGLRLPVHQGIAELVGLLVEETERRGYDVRDGQSWGFACRAIRGTSTPSNHSWGLAVDINAPANPMGSRLVTDMPNWMPELWEGFGFRWGGRYRSRPDAMHYEFMGTPQMAATQTLRARALREDEDDMYLKDGPSMRRLQKDLNSLLELIPGFVVLKLDGEWGTKTRGALDRIRAIWGLPDEERPTPQDLVKVDRTIHEVKHHGLTIS